MPPFGDRTLSEWILGSTLNVGGALTCKLNPAPGFSSRGKTQRRGAKLRVLANSGLLGTNAVRSMI
jgi:hypothetical protein